MEQIDWWGNDPYWTKALDAIQQAQEDGRKTVTIDLEKVSECIYSGDGPAYKLLYAMQSVLEHESYDGYRGAPRLVRALLWKLQELSNETDSTGRE